MALSKCNISKMIYVTDNRILKIFQTFKHNKSVSLMYRQTDKLNNI